MDYISVFAKNIRYLIKKMDINNSKLERDMGWGKNSVHNYVTGNSEPNYERTIKIAEYFSVSVDDLLRRDMSVGEGGSVVSDGILPYGNNKACQLRVAELESVIELQKKYIALLEGNIK